MSTIGKGDLGDITMAVRGEENAGQVELWEEG